MICRLLDRILIRMHICKTVKLKNADQWQASLRSVYRYEICGVWAFWICLLCTYSYLLSFTEKEISPPDFATCTYANLYIQSQKFFCGSTFDTSTLSNMPLLILKSYILLCFVHWKWYISKAFSILILKYFLKCPSILQPVFCIVPTCIEQLI